MILRAPPKHLFVYGTLRDADLFAAVAGKPLECYHPRRARALNARVVHAAGEPMPLLRRGGPGITGLLLSGIDRQSWRRILFYESTDYRLATIGLRLLAGKRAFAVVFWPMQSIRSGFRSWNLREWQRASKQRALVAAREFMNYLDAPPGTDLDRAWREINADLAG